MSDVMQSVRVPNGCEVFGNVAEPYTYSGWAKEVYHKKSGIFLVYVPAGKFKMGTKPGDEFAKHEIQHSVTLTKGFYMGKYPVTMIQFKKVYPKHKFAYMDINGEPEPINGMVPADHVKWEKGLAYCTKFGFRYPTEAEWEYACRAGTYEHIPNNLKDYAWFSRNSKGVSHPVGLKKANAWGLHDMLGNGQEWCSDWFDVYSKKAVIDPTGPATGAPDWLHVARGSNAKNSPDWCTRPAMRNPHCKSLTPYGAGFRVVMDLPEE